MSDKRPAVNAKRWRSGRSGMATRPRGGLPSLSGRVSASLLALLLLASEGMTLPRAGAVDLVVDSGTLTISNAQSYSTTTVATNSGDTATLSVTTSGVLTNSSTLTCLLYTSDAADE